MNKLIVALCLSAFLCIGVFAQNGNDEYKKYEFYGGYSNQQIDGGNYVTFNGFEAAATRNFSRYIGIKGDVSAAYRSEEFTANAVNGTTISTFTARQKGSVYNFLGGVQIKDNASTARFKPFAHALAGVAHTRSSVDVVSCAAPTCTIPVGNSRYNQTGFGAALGGGLDIKVNDRIDFRAIQIDYNPIYTSSSFDNNIRIGVGIVFK